MANQCSVDGCEREARGLGLCWRHYMRQRRTGSTEDGNQADRALVAGQCSVEGCDGRSEAKGLCFKHYMRQRRKGSTDDLPPKPTECSVFGCKDPVRTKGMCIKHYARYRKSGTTDDPPKTHAPLFVRIWKYIDKRGMEECWPWTGGVDDHGYGKIGAGGDGGRTLRAPRVIYEMAYGSLPDTEMVLHTCDNPSCCNPVHLMQGTQKDNMEGASRRGRMPTGGSWFTPARLASLAKRKAHIL